MKNPPKISTELPRSFADLQSENAELSTMRDYLISFPASEFFSCGEIRALVDIKNNDVASQILIQSAFEKLAKVKYPSWRKLIDEG